MDGDRLRLTANRNCFRLSRVSWALLKLFVTPHRIVWVLEGRPSKSMGKGKLWPSANEKPLNRSSPNSNGVITSWTPTTNKLGSIRPRVFVPHIGEIYTSLIRNLLHFFSSLTRLQTSPLDRFLRLIRQMTRLCARKCLFIVIKFYFLLIYSKNWKKLQ